MAMKTSIPAAAIRSARARHTGFGLVELMISVAIGLVILAALVALFVNASRNNREMASANSVIENGRFAIELLETDIVHAGYWGTYVPDFDDPTLGEAVPTSTPAAVPDPCVDYDAAEWVTGSDLVNSLVGIPVQVFDGDTPVCAGVVEDRVPGTDVLVLRHAERCLPGAGDCEDDDPANPGLFVQASTCAEEAEDTPYAFGRTGVEPFDLTQRDCATLADKRRFMSSLYYVRDYAAAPGDGIPTLVRSEFGLDGGTLAHQEPVPLIEGIDGLWVELGVDDVSITGDPVDNAAAVVWEDEETKQRATNRGDGIPDGDFVRCTNAVPCELDQLMNVTAVKVYVLARSRDATRGYTDTKSYTVGLAGDVAAFGDGFKRHVYSTTVRLHNVAGRRIRPGLEEVLEAGGGEPDPDPDPVVEPFPDPVDPVVPIDPVVPEAL